jgi:hypothetical protein
MTHIESLHAGADVWAARSGLRRDPASTGAPSLQPLFTATTADLVRDSAAAHAGAELLDRAIAFKPTGALRDSVLVSSPVEQGLLRRVGNPGRIVDEIWALASALSLRVRIGHPADRFDGAPGVLSIVWWDPERISLPYAPLD